MGKVQNALSSGVEKTRNALAEVRRRPKNALIDYTRGALMGVTTDVLGYPVDTVSMAMRPFGYNVDQPIGGSDWLANKLTSPTGSPSEMAGRITTGMLTPGPDEMLRLAGMLPKRGPVNELITYHGSPHRINNVDEANPMGKFDLSKVGTGEGAQAYGHGIYLAENPGVAKSYAANLADRNNPRDVVNSFILNRTQGGSIAGLREAMTQHQLLGPIFAQDQSLLDDAITLARGYDPASNSYTDAAIKAASRLDTKLPTPKGNFYTVDLPDEHIAKMLDWDAPLSEQPESVRKALASDPAFSAILRRYEQQAKAAGVSADPRGENVYAWLMSQEAGGTKEGASMRLAAAGIPGIKYFDGGSRAAGEGTRNFVIFDPDVAKILKRE
jgi:hypothetical protein